MIGAQQLVLDWRTWLKGMSSSSEIDDGGFSPESDGVNLTAKQGALYAPAALVDSDTDVRLTGAIIATSPDMVSFIGTNRLLVAANGSYYTYNGTKIPAVALQTDAVNTYGKFFTDIITFAGEAYVTTKEKLVRWQNPSTFNNSFASFTNTNRPHPAIVFENNAFYGDGNLLLRQTSAGGALTTILTLSTDQEIIALGIDPGTGKMLISTINSLNVSQILPSIAKLHWYDGFSSKTSKTVIVEEAITAFHPHGGEVFVGYKDNVGRVNGSGIEFMRRLLNVYLDVDYLPTKHNFASIGNNLYVLDGDRVLCYGEVIKGAGKIWYYCGRNKVNTNKFRCIFYAGLGKLGLSFDTTKFYTLAVSSISATAADAVPTAIDAFKIYTNNLDFARPIYPYSLQLEFVDSITQNAGGTSLTVQYYDNYSPSGGSTVGSLVRRNRPLTSNVQDEIVGFISGRKTTMLKFFISHTAAKGLRRLILFYDYAE